MALNALATTQPANQAPTGNLYMAPSGATYSTQAAYNAGATATGGNLASTNPNANVTSSNPTTLSSPIANQSTTTLSSNKTADILGIQNKQNTLTNGSGIKTDSNTGIATYANGSVVQPPKAPNDPSNMYNTETGQLNTNYTGYKPPTNDGTTSTGGYYNNLYIAPGGTVPKDANGQPVALTATNPQDDAFNSMLLDLKAKSDAIGAANIDNIQSAYANLVKQQELANASAAAGTTAYLVGAGRGVGSSDAVLQGTISYGIQQVANLQTQKNGDIIKAQQAISDNDFKYASAIQDRIDKNTALQQTEYDKVQENILQATKDLQAQKQKDTDSINAVAEEAAKSGAPADVIKAINASKSPAEAIAAYAPYAQDPTSDAGQYNAYLKQAQANGVTPLSPGDFMLKRDVKKASATAFASAYASATGKAAGEAKAAGANGGLLPVTGSNGITFQVPASVAPYVKISENGVKYIDASGLSAAEKGKIIKDAFNGGVNPVPVITDPTMALDVNNITDATLKLKDMRDAFTGQTAESAAQRNLYFAAANTVAKELQTNPNVVGLDIYQDAALDVLKAMSGTKGFRGGTSMVEQVQKTFPKATDTQDVVNQKIDNMQKLINDRQTGLIGNPSAVDQSIIDAKNAESNITTNLNNIKTTDPKTYNAASNMFVSIDPVTGHPYTADKISAFFPQLAK